MKFCHDNTGFSNLHKPPYLSFIYCYFLSVLIPNFNLRKYTFCQMQCELQIELKFIVGSLLTERGKWSKIFLAGPFFFSPIVLVFQEIHVEVVYHFYYRHLHILTTICFTRDKLNPCEDNEKLFVPKISLPGGPGIFIVWTKAVIGLKTKPVLEFKTY